jgi:folate-dependent phosphoribosylglycinamide formyltransferase PurN
VRQLIYDPGLRDGKMTIVCFISGTGTNYQRIVERDPLHNYVVFTNRPGCEGVKKAKDVKHVVIELSHIPYLRAAKERCGSESIPRNCPEREKFEQDVWRLIESNINQAPDLICLAGYDQWLTDWTVNRYYPKILNIHPGDTTRSYAGLHWIPAAKAILAGDSDIRSTVFLVDSGEDTGPVLVQSRPLRIASTLQTLESQGEKGLVEGLDKITGFAKEQGITTYEAFEASATGEQKATLKKICENLQDILKMTGDWIIYPFVVHDLIARGRVGVSDRNIFIDGRQMPAYGYRMDEQPPE